MQNVVYSVYKHTTPDELVYIGATVQKPKARWGVNGSNYKTNTRFYQAIQKYGWDNIKHEVVFETDNREDVNDGFWKVKDCPHIEVSIRCPHMVTKGGAIR